MAQVYSTSTVFDAEDLFQQMIVTLLERDAADPNFSKQNDSYILDAGRKAVCLPALKRARIEVKYTLAEPVTEDGEYFFDTIAGPGVNPEAAVIRLEEVKALAKATRSLTKRETEVIGLIASGVPSKTIAADFGINKAAVSIHRSNAIRKFQEAIA
jgi:RNA polymerase sigma factor (sigma-70 family)